MGASARLGGCVVALAVAGCGSGAPPASGVPLADGSDAAVSEVVEAITTFPDQLDPRIWDGTAMRPEVRDMSLKVVDRVVADARIDGLTVDAVELFGSNASYEYDAKADFGIHVFTHSPVLDAGQLSGVLGLLNDYVERRQEGRITFNGVVVEVTFHAGRTDNYRPRPGIGQYSLTEGRWVEMPTRQPDHFDRDRMTADIKRFIGEYNELASAYAANKKGFECSRFGDLDAEMAAYRNEGFARGLGSRSRQNLAYRALRRINVPIPDEVDRLEDDCTFVNESIG